MRQEDQEMPLPEGRRRAEPRSVRRWNERAVLESLRAHGPQRISALRESTGLTAGPLGELLRGLADKGWVEASADDAFTRGRPAQRFGLTVPAGRVLGVDVGAHMVRGVSADLAGRVLERVEVEVATPGDIAAMRAATAQAVAECTGPGEVWATGVAVGGTIDADGILVRSVAVPAWEGSRPLEVLGDLLPEPCTLINDVRAETFAEHETGAARDVEDFALAHLGRRPTLGIFLDGRIRLGAHGTAGDLSLHPQLGRTEQGGADEPRDPGSGRDALGDLLRRARDGEDEARERAARILERMADPLALAASVLDVGLVVVGGPFASVPDLALPALAQVFDERSRSVPELRATALDQFAAATGAALEALARIDAALVTAEHGALPRERSRFLEAVAEQRAAAGERGSRGDRSERGDRAARGAEQARAI